MAGVLNNYFYIAVISFIIGNCTGWFLHVFIRKQVNNAGEGTEKIIVLLAVTMIWFLSMLYDMFDPNYSTSPLVHGLMGVIVGFFFKPTLFKNDK